MGNRQNMDYGIEEQEKRIGELEQQVRTLEAALQAAEETNQAKSRFLSNMSHDIRPLSVCLILTRRQGSRIV